MASPITVYMYGEPHTGKDSLLEVLQPPRATCKYITHHGGKPGNTTQYTYSISFCDSKMRDLKVVIIRGEPWQDLPEPDVIILCYSAESHDSFMGLLNKWIPQINQAYPWVPVIVAQCTGQGGENIKTINTYFEEDKAILAEKGALRMHLISLNSDLERLALFRDCIEMGLAGHLTDFLLDYS